MSAPITKRLLTCIHGNNVIRLTSRTIFVKLKSTPVGRFISNDVSSHESTESGTMNAAVLYELSSPLAIKTVAIPKCTRPYQVLVDVQYCALNPIDILLSKNVHYWEPKIPMILGYEIMGKLIEVGEEAEKNGFNVGDRVIALNQGLYGGLAEKCVVNMEDVWKIPASVRGLDAVCLLSNYMTALIALDRQASINEDDMILINVGVSGIGLAATDLATNVFRAKVMGISATENDAALIRDKGVFTSFKFEERKLIKHIEELATEKNITDIFKGEKGKYFKEVLNCFTDIYKGDATLLDMYRDGHFIVIVHHLSQGRVIVAGTAASQMKRHSEMNMETIDIAGFNLHKYKKRNLELYRQVGDEILQFFEDSLITPSCTLIAGLHKINEALQFSYNMKSSGKVVIDVKNQDAAVKETKQN